MNILVRSLDDPFEGPPEHQFRCFATGRDIDLSLLDCWRYGILVDFACLTVDFGGLLRDLIAEAPEEQPGVVAAAPGDAACATEEPYRPPPPLL